MIRWLYLIVLLVLAYLLFSGSIERFGVIASLALTVCFVFAALAGALLLSRKKSATMASCRRPLRRSDFAAFAAAGLALISFLLLFFLHTPPLMEQASDSILAVLIPEKSQQTRQLEAATAGSKAKSGNWLWTDQTIRPLPRRARLRPGSQPEVFLQIDDATDAQKLLEKRAYVSAFALGTYEDASWSLTPADTTSMPSYPQRTGKVVEYEIFHPADPSGQTPLSGLQGLTDAAIAPLSYRGDGVTILPPFEGSIGYRYRARSRPLSIDDLSDQAKAMPRTRVPAAWLTLPEEETLVIGIRGLNAESVSPGNLRTQLQQIRDAMQTECSYSLDIINPDNRDPLENFLFHEKSGHCEMFATAGVMCARALGVPARIAYGWAGGSYYKDSNLFVFRAREAHAWTEVLIEDIGWVVMDCTPANSIGASRSAPPEEKPLADVDPTTMDDSADAAVVDRARLSRGLGVAAAICFLAVVLLLLMRPREAAAAMNRGHHAGAAPSYLRQFFLYCGKKQLRLFPGRTVRALLRALPVTPRFAEALLRYHYQTQYGQQAPDREREQQLSDEIRKAQE